MDVMDPVTDNPAPELGALEKFLEQVGAWMDAVPAVPPLVEWIVIFGGPVIYILWVRWGTNWWAARSKNAAETRARRLLKRVVEVHGLSRNRPAMIVASVRIIMTAIIGSMFFLLGAMFLLHIFSLNALGLPPSDFLISGRKNIGSALLGLGIIWFLISWFWNFRIEPLFYIDEYTERARNRIEKLLAKAGVPDEFALEFLRDFDDQVDVARKQEIR